jgi:hypothetical protein
VSGEQSDFSKLADSIMKPDPAASRQQALKSQSAHLRAYSDNIWALIHWSGIEGPALAGHVLAEIDEARRCLDFLAKRVQQ